MVVGSGRLAHALCHSLAATAVPEPVRVTVLARNHAAAADLARTSQVRASVSGAAVHFSAQPWTEDLAFALDRLRPTVLVCVASAQSPYERVLAPSAWTDLIGCAGFGATLALQAELVARLAHALARTTSDALLVNGCFPDAVNPVLAGLGLPVHCGLGNVATLAACLQAALDLPDQRELRMLGHHAHLAQPAGAAATDAAQAQEVLVWRGGQPMPGVTDLLAGYRALPRTELNAIAGHAAARLLAELVGGSADLRTNLPGPVGLPGGYPVHLRGRSLELNLPAGLSRADAVAWNAAAGLRDGVEVIGSKVSYPDPAQAVLARYLPEVAVGWPVTALPEVCQLFTDLRQQLRTAPPVPAAPAE
ncbi:MAG TPA: potassium transporter TrkA [Micromonosporaceae bacterium]